MSEGHSEHGSTPAAWTLVVIVTLGFVISTTALVLGNWTYFWVGVGVVILGGVVGKAMQAAGLGQKKKSTSAETSAGH